jgi:hypothetical protein
MDNRQAGRKAGRQSTGGPPPNRRQKRQVNLPFFFVLLTALFVLRFVPRLVLQSFLRSDARASTESDESQPENEHGTRCWYAELEVVYAPEAIARCVHGDR